MRILLTGGTGFIGGALYRVLLDRGDDVVLVSRGSHDVSVRADRPGTGWDKVAAEVERADAVVHLAGEPIAAGRWTKERLERIRASRVETTSRIADAMGGAGRRPRVFVSASAVGAYGMRADDQVLREADALGDDELARICAAWEAAAEPARRAGVRVVHPRLGMVLGRGGGALAKMEPAFRWFVGGPLGEGRQWVSWIHRRDAVRALLFAIDQDVLSGPVNFVAPEPVRMADLARALGRAMRRPARLPVPAAALRALLGPELARLLLTGQRVVPEALERSGFAFSFRLLEDALHDLYGRGVGPA